jgi:DNA replication and repair protein RecF
MLSEIEVRDFRCFSHTRLELHPQTTVLLGRNAQGKTSLLEAACVLLRLQSPRTTARTDLIRFDSKHFMVEGLWNEHTLRCGMSSTLRRLALDGAVCSRMSDYLQHSGLVVWMDHADMNLVRGGSEHRRRFLDFAASQVEPDYLHALQGYNRALRSRNYVLKREAQVNWRQAEAYARVMEGFHLTLTSQRRQLLATLTPRATAMLAMLSGGREQLELSYLPGCLEGSLCDQLQANRQEEERTRTTFTGAHRDDFQVLINGRTAEAFASEGQQRSIALALKMSQAQVLEQVHGRPPVLLIDDVFGELDPLRRRALLEGLPKGTQSVITTTHLDWAGMLGDSLRIYEVENAQVTVRAL